MLSKLKLSHVVILVTIGLFVEANIFRAQVVIAPRPGSSGGGGSGNVVGPGSSTTHHIAAFADNTGQLLEDIGFAFTAIPFADITGVTITEGLLSFSDNTTANVSTTKHGLTPKLPNSASVYLDGTGAFSTPAGAGTVINYVTKTANYTLVNGTDDAVECLTNAFTLTLPTAVGHTGQAFYLKNAQTANACTVNTTSAQTIDGQSTLTITNNSFTVKSDGANWRLVNSLGLLLTGTAAGDIPYFDTASHITTLPKDTNATRYAANTGTGNVIKWDQVNLSNGITSILGIANGGTGQDSAITISFPFSIPAASCQGSTAYSTGDLPASSPAVANCVSGLGVVDYAASSDLSGTWHYPCSLTTSTSDITINWFSSTTSGAVAWLVTFATAAAGQIPGQSFSNWNSGSVVTTVDSTTTNINHSTITGATLACSGKELTIKVRRNAGSGSDTMSGTARIISILLTHQLALTVH